MRSTICAPALPGASAGSSSQRDLRCSNWSGAGSLAPLLRAALANLAGPPDGVTGSWRVSPLFGTVATLIGAADRSLREGIIPVQARLWYPHRTATRTPSFSAGKRPRARVHRAKDGFLHHSVSRAPPAQPTPPTPLHLEPRWIGGFLFPRRGRDARRAIVRAPLQRILYLGARRSLTAGAYSVYLTSLSIVGQQPPRLTSLSLPFLTSSAVADALAIPHPRATIPRA
ncbi:hypothetical protein DFH09DRAFT_1308962 [Mycena vulgaris]|nr:hypothetical protein DFH09DRAFT_1308962 [Mycena vulgaris]